MKVFYNCDMSLDGIFAGAILATRLKDAQWYGVNMLHEFPYLDIRPGETVFLLDWHPSRIDEMADIYDKVCGSNIQPEEALIWIDKSPEACQWDRDNKDLYPIAGVRNADMAVCQMAWNAFGGNDPIPDSVLLLSEYVRFGEAARREAWYFYEGLRVQEELHPQSPLLQELLGDRADTEYFMEIGASIQVAQDIDDQKIAAVAAFPAVISGLRIKCINKPLANFRILRDMYDHAACDATCAFYFNGTWTLWLWSERIEVIEKISATGYGDQTRLSENLLAITSGTLPFELNGEKT